MRLLDNLFWMNVKMYNQNMPRLNTQTVYTRPKTSMDIIASGSHIINSTWRYLFHNILFMDSNKTCLLHIEISNPLATSAQNSSNRFLDKTFDPFQYVVRIMYVCKLCIIWKCSSNRATQSKQNIEKKKTKHACIQ